MSPGPDITPREEPPRRATCPGVSLSTAVRQPRSFVSYRGRHFAARDESSTFQGAIPARLRAGGRLCLAVPRAEPTHELPTRACVRLRARLRGVEPERAGLRCRRRALASVRRVRATSVLIGVSRSVWSAAVATRDARRSPAATLNSPRAFPRRDATRRATKPAEPPRSVDIDII